MTNTMKTVCERIIYDRISFVDYLSGMDCAEQI